MPVPVGVFVHIWRHSLPAGRHGVPVLVGRHGLPKESLRVSTCRAALRAYVPVRWNGMPVTVG